MEFINPGVDIPVQLPVSAVNHIIMPLISSFSYQFVFLFFLLFHLLAAFQSWDSLHGPSPAGDRWGSPV